MDEPASASDLSVKSVSRTGECELTDGREASLRSTERLSNMTESEEKDQIITAVEQKWKHEDVLKNFPGVSLQLRYTVQVITCENIGT